MRPASNRLLAGPIVAPLALMVALAPMPALAGPYRVLAPAAAPASGASPSAAPPADGATSSAATSPGTPLSNDPALEYRLGEQAYALGNYEQAVRHFERSYQLSNFADLLYNLGMAHAQWHGLDGDIGHLRKAKRLFQNYTKRLAENPAMDQSQRDEAEAQIARIDEQIAEHEAKHAAPPPIVQPDPEPERPPPVEQPAKKPVYKRGWFWGVLGAVVVAGAVTAAVVLTRDPRFEPELGVIGPNAAPSPLGLRF